MSMIIQIMKLFYVNITTYQGELGTYRMLMISRTHIKQIFLVVKKRTYTMQEKTEIITEV